MTAKEAQERAKKEAEARKKKRTKLIPVALIAIAVLIGAVFGGYSLAHPAANTSTASEQSTDTVAGNSSQAMAPASNIAAPGSTSEEAKTKSEKDKVKLTAELKKILDVANGPINDATCSTVIKKTGGKVTDDGTYGLLLETLKNVKAGDNAARQWSDALSIPLKGTSTKEKHEYITRAICEEPVIGVSLAHLFAHLEVEGVRVLDLQSTDWLKKYDVDASEINDLVADFLPLTDWKLKNISKGDAPDEVYEEALQANHEYQELGSRLNLLLSKYEVGEVLSINSTHHYHLKAGGLSGDSIPEVEVSSEPDTKLTLVFYLTKKTDDCKPISVLGFNIGDKRPMLGDTVNSCEELTTPLVPATPLQPVIPYVPEVPYLPPTPWNPPPPTCEYNCEPYLEPKNPAEGSWQQGNAPIGGGNNNNPGPGDPTTPVQPPSTPYEPPAPPTSNPPGGTPDPTAPPAAEPEAPTPSNPETGCTPMPGVSC